MSVASAFGACQLTQRQAEEGAGREQLAPDPAQHLLLARGAVEVVLGRRAGVLAHAREAQRLAAVELLLALGEVEARGRSCRTPAQQIAVLLFTVMPPSASMNSGKSSKSTSTMWLISRPLPRKPSTVSIISAGAAEGVGGVDLLDAVAGDLGARRRAGSRACARCRRPTWRSMIVSARPGPAWLSSSESPLRCVGAEHEDRAAREEVAAARQRRLGLADDALLELGADHEQHERQQQPADHARARPT